ncbi:alpha-tectorin-like [Cyclopterus lumpus]|uniref:alpha-tectorin-like n=1 Tax=Cyclopterus lumpus TaxID=8103 RepID=UPI001485E78D|nr:alpha-tectorin-like [Cyclopterus lumpus]
MKTGALLFVLAVAASQVELYLSVTLESGDKFDISSCPIFFYGKEYTEAEVTFHPDSSFSLCFDNTDLKVKECLLLADHGGANSVFPETVNIKTESPSALHTALPSITQASECSNYFTLQDDDKQYIFFDLYKFGSEAAFVVQTLSDYSPATLNMETKIGNRTMGSWSYTKSEAEGIVYEDLTGCRSGGVIISEVAQIRNPENCTVLSCDAHDSMVFRGCPVLEVCMGNNTNKECVRPPSVCTVTGSTVIDFFNEVHSIPDRCAYEVMNNSEVKIYAVFEERLLEDVLFLNYLQINIQQTVIYLEQGGIVRINSQIQTLTSTPQQLQGVELSKDQTGVTLKTPATKTIVHFDGDTAHVTGENVARSGLCGNPLSESESTTTVSESLYSPLSPTGCDNPQSKDVDSTVDCSVSNEYCGLMSQAPFTACHIIDPEPYITACKSTTCKYTADNRAVDNVACQYMEAYAKACFLKVNVTLGDWRSNASCSATRQASCLDHYCSDHEFCVEKLGEAGCSCRAAFASKYHSTDTLGEPTVCMQSSIKVTLAECLLWDKGLDSSTLHLNDPDCKGHSDNQTHMLTFLLEGDACGTEVIKNDSHVIYKNKITMGNSSLNETITRQKQVEIDFSCAVIQPEIQSASFRIKDSFVFQHIETEVLNYTVMMTAYTDAGFNHHVENDTDIQLNQRIWLEMKMQGLDDNTVAVVTDSCWTTNQSSPNSSLSYYLVIDRCPNPADQTVEMEGNGLGLSNSVSFRMFHFADESSGANSEIYLHCKLVLCPKSPSCAPVCGATGLRKRRSSKPGYAEGGQALITMVWNN